MNSVNITGRLTADPVLKQTQSGVPVCSYTLAVKRPRVKDTTDFLNFVTWRQGAEYLTKFGHKGDVVVITGSLTSRKWQDNNGNDRLSFEVVTDTVELVGGKKQEQSVQQGDNAVTQPQATAQPFVSVAQQEFEIISDDELPF